jgi:cell division protein FtsN
VAQEQNADDSGAIRKKAVTRLIVAGVVTMTALGALWWLDQSGKPDKPAAIPAPSPIVSAPATPPQPAPEPEPPSEAVSAPGPNDAPPPPEVAEPQAAPAPGRKTASATAGVSAPSQLSAPPAQRTPPSPSPTTTAPAASSTPPGKAEAAKTYIVQLGVFADPANARELVERLVKAGVKAQMETRVHIGPFQNRQEADQARAELVRLGIKGVVATK